MRNSEFALLRLRFIEAILITHGCINRQLIIGMFGVTEPTASRDLRAYREINSGVVFNHSLKQYVCTDDFMPSKDLLHIEAGWFISMTERLFNKKVGMVAHKQNLGVIEFKREEGAHVQTS